MVYEVTDEASRAEEDFIRLFSPLTRFNYGSLLLSTFSAVARPSYLSLKVHGGAYKPVRALERAGLVEYVRNMKKGDGDWETGEWIPIRRRFPFVDPSKYVRLTQRGLDVYNELREAGSADATEEINEIRIFYVPWTEWDCCLP